jgi:hypothetical protein
MIDRRFQSESSILTVDVLWRQLGDQMRPVALDDPAHFRIDRLDGVELLDPLSDSFQFLRLEWTPW